VLTAGGPAQVLEVEVKRTGDGPVRVEVEPPAGVEARPTQAELGAGQSTARFELVAAPAAVAWSDRARVTARAGDAAPLVRYVPVVIRKLDFRPTLAAPGEVALMDGQRRTVPVRIDRAGGYRGPLTLTLLESPVLEPATVTVPAGAAEAELPLTARPDAPAGPATVRVRATAPDAGLDHDLPLVVRVLDLKLVRTFTGHGGRVNCVAVAHDGRLALSGGADGTVRLWEVATGREKWKADAHPGGVLSVAFSAEGRQALSGGADKSVQLWDVGGGKSRPFEKEHGGDVWLVHFADSKTAISVSADKTVHWVVATGRPRMVPDGKRDLILGQKMKPDVAAGEALLPATKVPSAASDYLLAGWGTDMLEVYRRGLTRPQARLRAGGAIRVMALSADGKRALTYGEDKQIRLWEVRPPRSVQGFPWAPEVEVTSAAFTPDGTVLLGGADGTVKLWQLPP
jgi:WD40 repeat protein